MIDDDEPGWLRRNLASVIAAVVACGVIGAVAYVASHLGDTKPTLKQIQQVTLLKPPPPPPPPPDKPKPIEDEKTPEPEMIKPLDDVKPLPPMPDLPPPPGPLGLDSEGTGPGDSYGLVGQPGGRALGEGGHGAGGGTGGPASWKWYASAVQAEFTEAISNNEKTRYADFPRTKLAIWATPDGQVTKIRLHKSTGDPELDAAIERELTRRIFLRQPPPKDMPMPIVIYVNPRPQRQG